MADKPVPVVMFHLVCDGIPGWAWNHLCWKVAEFERMLKMLKRFGYTAIDHYELYDYMAEGKPLPKKPILLTFDDGYLDNWVYAYPLLKKHGFKGTVYVNPEFADPRPIVRPTLLDVEEGRVQAKDLDVRGFLSWEEMKRACADGVLDVQSHLMTHTWYPSGPKIVDFHRPGAQYYWLAWNRNPGRKPYYLAELEEQEQMVPYGVPVYEHGKSVAVRRYREDAGVADACVKYVNTHGGPTFFTQPDWGDRLRALAEPMVAKLGTDDRIETEDEYLARVRYELVESRRIISEKLNKPVDIVCWPGGGYNEETIRIAREVGYKASTVKGNPNLPGSDPSRVHRISAPTPSLWKFGEALGQFYFLLHVERTRRNPVALGICKIVSVTGVRRKLDPTPD